MQTVEHSPGPGYKQLALAILAVDVLIGLFPPLYWWAGQGSIVLSLIYFIGGGAFMTASIFVLYYIEASERRYHGEAAR